MRTEIIQYLDQRPDQKLFVRLHPEWYRLLSRDPWQLNRLKKSADAFYGRTLGQRLDRLNSQIGLMSMLMNMTQAVVSQSQPDK
ncbi:YlbE-like family protein [Sporolactobacillus vineae]|uniref:YlbE-like family protein n=1 Tax=Sporolactobacillus vineae TaxID=444463 RepID=UPI00028A19BD|nr:YlbE-like family protein [Sporolactobacillus vineae]